MKVALVHDWLTGMRGGEKVLEMFCEIFPHADVFTLIHFPGTVSDGIESRHITTSFLQRIPLIRSSYRYALPFMPMAIESLDLKGYDLVISTSHCVAKGCKPPKTSTHICYCFTPMRYIWDQFDNYFRNNQSGWVARSVMKAVRPYLQNWDTRSSSRVQHFIADSGHVRDRIKRCYGRDAAVIYPPTDTDFYNVNSLDHSSDFYLIVSALAPYKRLDIAIETFNRTGKKLKIIGSGQSEKKLKAMAGPNIEFLGWRSDKELLEYYRSCRALLFPGTEDFGIVPVEAMSCGRPVIAYRSGGALETVADGKTGLFFDEPKADSLAAAVESFEKKSWNPEAIRNHALRFSKEQFRTQIKNYLKENLHFPS